MMAMSLNRSFDQRFGTTGIREDTKNYSGQYSPWKHQWRTPEIFKVAFVSVLNTYTMSDSDEVRLRV